MNGCGDDRSKDNTMLDGSMNSVSQNKSIGSPSKYEGGEAASPMKRPKTSRHGSGLALRPVSIEGDEPSPRYDRLTQKEILHQEM